MSRYSYGDPAEREPLDDQNMSYNSSQGQYYPQQHGQRQRNQEQYYEARPDQQYDNYSPSPQQQRRQQQQPYGGYVDDSSPPRAAVGARRPVQPPSDPQYNNSRPRSERRRSPDQHTWNPAAVASQGTLPPNADIVSPTSPPQQAGRDDNGQHWGQQSGYPQHPAASQTQPKSTVTPGSDNFSQAALGGGMAQIAYSVADRNARESGMEAMRTANPHQLDHPDQIYQGGRHHQQHPMERPAPYGADSGDRSSHSSSIAGFGAAIPPGMSTPGSRTPSRSPNGPADPLYTDDPYSGYSRANQASLGVVNPHDIYDDGDDGLDYGRKSYRTSMLSLGKESNRSGTNVAGAAAGAGALGTGLAVGRGAGNGRTGASYGPVSNLSAGGSHDEVHNLGAEKSWGMKPENKSKKWKIFVIALFAILVIAGVVLGVLFGFVFKNGGNNGGRPGQSAADDQAQNGDLNADSAEIKALMNNQNLHKVFMGMDYTPMNAQYPDCIKNPPSQNNVTRDVAVLSQLTNTIRLYGTDCNQTQMVIHAVERLKLKDVKIWMGVWLDGNSTTNQRQMQQMWDILDEYKADPFKGLIIGNEVLFRKQLKSTEVQGNLTEVRNKLKQRGFTLPVATSDLGSDWVDKSLADASDYIMANIHPFFGGQPAEGAAAWTMEFWKNNIGPNQKAIKEQNVIAEIGWPSQGGQRCPPEFVTLGTACSKPAVASVDGLNQVLQDWVCPALNNGTNYFWFSAFDEPWKIKFNSGNENWEDHWGLMDVDRALKPKIEIPDCGGKTVPAA